MGGRSLESEVSFNSGRTICDHLDKQKYTALPIFQHHDGHLYLIPLKFLYRGKISDFEHRLATEARQIYWHDIPALVDIVYIAQHGRFGEDGCAQALLELYTIPYIGSKVAASALGMHKAMQKIFLQHAGITVAHGVTIAPHEHAHVTQEFLATNNLTLPVIVKPVHEGSSFGVTWVNTFDELSHAVTRAATIYPDHVQDVIIEECITGMEFSCIVVFDATTKKFKALSVTEVEHNGHDIIYDYEQKYMPGRAIKWTPARCTPEDFKKITDTCVRVMDALEFTTIGRIDGFLTPQSEVIIIDPNTLSGMAPSSFTFMQAAQCGMTHTDLINYLIDAEIAQQPLAPRKSSVIYNAQVLAEHTVLGKTAVAVLFGGASHEREISLESGRNVYFKLQSEGYCAIAVFLNSNNELFVIDHQLIVSSATHTIESQVTDSQRVSWDMLADAVDFVFIALHGNVGENGTVQGALEMLQVPYNGSSVLTSALCMDKYKTALVLKSAGCAVPEQNLLPLASIMQPEIVNYPVIVKPHNDGCSVGVHKADNLEQLLHALQTLKAEGFSHALVEEYVRGMELTVGVLGNSGNIHVLPPSAAIATGGILSIEEKFLPGAGENQTPAPLPETTLSFVKREIERAYSALGCSGYARIDCFYQSPTVSPTGTERLVILEINSLPGLTPATCIFHQAAEENMSPGDFLKKIIELGFEKHSKKLYVERETHPKSIVESML